MQNSHFKVLMYNTASRHGMGIGHTQLGIRQIAL